jgi:hypothetical protein
MPITGMTEKQIIGSADNMPQRAGRHFICIGPHCWGMGKTAKEAIGNAKKNRVKIYEGKRGWCFILFDAHEDTTVDDMGSLCYYPNRLAEDERPYIEMARYNMPKENVR